MVMRNFYNGTREEKLYHFCQRPFFEGKNFLYWLRKLLYGKMESPVLPPSVVLDQIEEKLRQLDQIEEKLRQLRQTEEAMEHRIDLYSVLPLIWKIIILPQILKHMPRIAEHLNQIVELLQCTTDQVSIVELLRQVSIVELLQCTTDQVLASQNTKVHRRRWTGKRDPGCDPSNRIIDIITQDHRVVIIATYDVQGGSSGREKVAKGGRGRERSISGGQDGKATRDINRDHDPAPQANGGVEGRDESWDGFKREKGSGGRDGGSMGGGQEEEVVPDIKRDCHQTLHNERNRRPELRFGVPQANGSVERRGESPDELKWESGSNCTCGGRDQERGESGGSEFRDEKGEDSGSVESLGRGVEGSGFGSKCRDVKGEGSGSVESECRDAEEGEGSRSGANQDRDGEGKGSSSGESQGQDRGEGSASGENQGGDRNAEGSESNDDEDERERQRRVGGDIEQGIQENNQEEIKFTGIPEACLAIIGATSIAAVDFHSSGAISSTILSLVMAINVFGFLCCMTSMLHRHRKPRAARIFGTIGAAAAGFGLLLPVSEYFSSYYGWMILVLGTLAILAICGLAFFP